MAFLKFSINTHIQLFVHKQFLRLFAQKNYFIIVYSVSYESKNSFCISVTLSHNKAHNFV
jgi:hypothetical protein